MAAILAAVIIPTFGWKMLYVVGVLPVLMVVRKIDAALDFEFIYPIVEATYSDLGRPSIDPVMYY
ncbi:hypothetical protein EfmJHP36_20860 [Enterococcus faecium]|nr:hypothetical protein EfmJHP36_20860 [Enterococcus faecium]